MLDNFEVKQIKETREDNPNLAGYRVKLNGRNYVMYYDQDKLREVYFFWFRGYCMSCRTDFLTVSHYYVENGIAKRYENGVMNKTYRWVGNKTISSENGREVVYTVRPCDNMDSSKLYRDLINFLSEFNDRDMTSLFQKTPIPLT